jgi:hypothetical protein
VLGRFLELGIVTPDTGAAWMQLQQLGFTGATAGEIWPHAYGAVACEGLAIGLHEVGREPRSLIFVQPDVDALRRELLDRLIDIEIEQVGSDVFNEIGLREPGGMLLRVIGARTFSPPADLPEGTSLGRFRAISLPCADLGEAQGFWERLDMDVLEITDPWNGIAVQGLPIAYHEANSFREVALLFDGKEAARQLVRGPEKLALISLPA